MLGQAILLLAAVECAAVALGFATFAGFAALSELVGWVVAAVILALIYAAMALGAALAIKPRKAAAPPSYQGVMVALAEGFLAGRKVK